MEEVIAYFSERFGIPAKVFDGRRIIKEGSGFWLAADSPQLTAAQALLLKTQGLIIAREIQGRLKPTSAGLLFFAPDITKNIIELPLSDLNAYLLGKEIPCPAPLTAGYAAVRVAGEFLGCGLYFPGRLFSRFPRSGAAGYKAMLLKVDKRRVRFVR